MFAENLKYLRNKHDMEQIELATKLGRKSSSSISEWEKGKYTPKLKTLNEISKIFGVDIDDLMNVDLSLKTTIVANNESHSTIEIIYSQLNEQRQTKVYHFATKQLEQQNSNVTSIDKKKVYVLGKTAANPTEVSYGDAVYDETIDTNVPRNADCALVIQGDSMEPLLHDGSIVFYKQQCEVENGEVAIVDIDGNGVTCKKVYFNYDDNVVILKSLNEKYDDRELSPERVRVIGKVVR